MLQVINAPNISLFQVDRFPVPVILSFVRPPVWVGHTQLQHDPAYGYFLISNKNEEQEEANREKVLRGAKTI